MMSLSGRRAGFADNREGVRRWGWASTWDWICVGSCHAKTGYYPAIDVLGLTGTDVTHPPVAPTFATVGDAQSRTLENVYMYTSRNLLHMRVVMRAVLLCAVDRVQ